MLSDILKKLQRVTREANLLGLNLPMVKDPKTGKGSISASLVVISSFLVMLSIVGKWSGKFGGVDNNSAMEFFYASCGLYWMRKFSRGFNKKKPS